MRRKASVPLRKKEPRNGKMVEKKLFYKMTNSMFSMMKSKVYLIIVIIVLFFNQSVKAQALSPKIEPGVSRELATYRASKIEKLRYTLDFKIPPVKTEDIAATELLTFALKPISQPLQIDFKQPAHRISLLKVNHIAVEVKLVREHLLIDPKYLHTGKNIIEINFTTGDQSLNRNDDYLYALFVPDRARTVFPCFDQPDLKATFLLTLQVPADLKVFANAKKTDSVKSGPRVTFHFANSDLLPTYLFSFTAGKYRDVHRQLDNRDAELLYRETDTAKIRLSVDSIFNIHRDAIRFLQKWTGIPFPFQKVGFVAIPDFQFGGMEHPGEVQYNASTLFLDQGATKNQFIARINLLSHETSHMWFGDLVTMKWFNDVWMKEVFANFMADKVTKSLMGGDAFNLKFLQDNYPAAYSIDRTQGANPIRQQLDNLQDAGSLYGNIIYDKAPIMMRQLELLVGKERFRKGVQEYLSKYAYQNASWNDLIAILSRHTKFNLYQWNQVWVNETGRPVFDYKISYKNNKISSFTLTQHPEFGKMRIWPQVFQLSLVYADSQKSIAVNMNSANVDLKAAIGLLKPKAIIFNSDGIGYGAFPFDMRVRPALYTIKQPIERASLYIAAYENMLSGRYLKPEELLTIFINGLTKETEETNLKLLTGYIGSIYWQFLVPSKRKEISGNLEHQLWNAMELQATANNKKILFKTYQGVYLSDSANEIIYNIWKKQQAPAGIKLTEDDYTSLALTIALKDDTAGNVLKKQEERIQNVDRKKRLEFLMPALSANPAVRDSFFYSLEQRQNRQKEAWVAVGLAYLNHPLRQASAEKFLKKSLDMVEEIQITGDIFFPQSWLSAILSNYQNKQAAITVRDFLSAHPHYNPKLREKILQSADNIFRAQNLLNQ
jgi:aminopeptidase N